jgi:hypothetical protein
MRAVGAMLRLLAAPRTAAEEMAALASAHQRLNEAIRWLRSTRGRVVRCRPERRRLRVLRAWVADRHAELYGPASFADRRAADRIRLDTLAEWSEAVAWSEDPLVRLVYGRHPWLAVVPKTAPAPTTLDDRDPASKDPA